MASDDIAAAPEGVGAGRPRSVDHLLSEVASGDRAAFASLYDAVAPTVFGLVLRVVRDRSRAEEISQDAFVNIWTQAPRFDPERGSAMAWICTIAHRRAVDVVRREQARRDRELHLASVATPADPGPEEVVTTADEAARVRLALGDLSELQRQALDLAYFGGRTYREVAEHLDVPLGTIKTRMRDGLAKLGRLMEAHHG